MWIWHVSNAFAVPLDCDASTEKSALLALLIEADHAIADLDPDSLGDAVARARDTIRCLGEPLTTLEVAHLYRVSGISWYVTDDLIHAVEDFAVAKAVDPNASIDTALGKPLRQTYDAVPPSTGEKLELPRPTEGYLHVDGARAEEAPADRGYFAQWLSDEGEIRSSWMVAKGQIPPYAQKGGGSEPNGGGEKAKPGKALLIAGLASGLVGVGSMVGAGVLENSFDNSRQRSGQLGSTIALNRTLGYGGIGLGAAGVGLMGVSFAVGF
jgi:hypothetical protein